MKDNKFYNSLLNEIESKKSNYVIMTINIESGYKWGTGWESRQSQMEFKNEVYARFKEHGYNIKRGSHSGASDSLLIPGDFITDIYMHPMEFTGPIPKNRVQEVYDILNNCRCITNVGSVMEKCLYELNNENYGNLLARHSREILEILKKYKKRGLLYDAEFAYMRDYKIFRIYGTKVTKSTHSSNDYEYLWISSFKTAVQEFGLL